MIIYLGFLHGCMCPTGAQTDNTDLNCGTINAKVVYLPFHHHRAYTTKVLVHSVYKTCVNLKSAVTSKMCFRINSIHQMRGLDLQNIMDVNGYWLRLQVYHIDHMIYAWMNLNMIAKLVWSGCLHFIQYTQDKNYCCIFHSVFTKQSTQLHTVYFALMQFIAMRFFTIICVEQTTEHTNTNNYGTTYKTNGLTWTVLLTLPMELWKAQW